MDPGPEEQLVDGAHDAFISVFDANGNYLWSGNWPSWWQGSAIEVDPLGFVYVGGAFAGEVDFDPGPGVEERAAIGKSDTFLSVFTKNGNFLGVGTWDCNLNGSPPSIWDGDIIIDIKSDESGNLYVATQFREMIDMDPGPGQDYRWSLAGMDAIILKLHVSGELIWARNWGDLDGARIVAMDLGSDGNIYGAGSYHGKVDFDPGPDIDFHDTPPGNSTGAYAIKFPPSGNW